MVRTSQIQWRALSRRSVVIRSLACAAGAAASLAPVKEGSDARDGIRELVDSLGYNSATFMSAEHFLEDGGERRS